ncbi:acetyltransferase [Oribacterium sinus]|uniref:acetyltransferase n=1 Tax=Oribacterium sinus TaxID=237576 RepID=UPI0028D35EED|nr:acetyltransferase [Oribacterium sinus]
MKEVVIVGASGHGKVVADIVLKSGDKVFGFLDDNPKMEGTFCGFPVLGRTDEWKMLQDKFFIIAIGNPGIRESMSHKIQGEFYTAIHPSAQISLIDIKIEEGTTIMANAVINSGSYVGRHCIINSTAVVEHDNRISDFVHISVGAKVAGTVEIGARTWIGMGACINNNLSICSDCIIGAGAVVIKSIEESGIYIGVPARKLKVD